MSTTDSVKIPVIFLKIISVSTLVFIISTLNSCKRNTPSKTNNTNENHNLKFENISYDVQYVGDEECFACHSSIYESFKKNGMGMSFYKPSKENIIEDYHNKNLIFDTLSKFYYKMHIEGENFYQTEFRKDPSGNITHELTKKIDYLIGSGRKNRSYILSENDFLFMLPVTWYSEKKMWDMSPGYRKENLRFSRAILKECMNCHNSYAGYTEGSENKYRKNVPFGIGCERCHGPGELHVKKQLEIAASENTYNEEKDYTIVNPVHLDVEKQLDVCMQCHLQGDVHVFKQKRDFIPGMRLRDFKEFFIIENPEPEKFKIAGHGTRLIASECYKKSGGRLLCTTCHDPHNSTINVTKQFFNSKCMDCHAPATLSISKEGVNHSGEGDCISCHMKKNKVEIPHVNMTDHWIRKKFPEPENNFSKKDTSSAVTLKPLFSNSDNIYLGIAYVKYFEEKHGHRQYLNNAVTILEKEIVSHPEHKLALNYLGRAYYFLGRYFESEKHFRNYLKSEDNDADAWFVMGSALENTGNLTAAIEAYTKCIQIFPDHYKAYNSLGNLYSSVGNIPKAVEAYIKSIQIISSYSIAMNNLGDLYLYQKNDTASAMKYFRMALDHDPDFIMPYFNIANILLMNDNFTEAEKILLEIISRDKSFGAAYGNLALIEIKRNNKDKAAKYLNRLLEINPGDMQAKELLKQIR